MSSHPHRRTVHQLCVKFYSRKQALVLTGPLRPAQTAAFFSQMAMLTEPVPTPNAIFSAPVSIAAGSPTSLCSPFTSRDAHKPRIHASSSSSSLPCAQLPLHGPCSSSSTPHEHVITCCSFLMRAHTPPHILNILPFMSGLCLPSRLSLPLPSFPHFSLFLFLSWSCLPCLVDNLPLSLSWHTCRTVAAHSTHSYPSGRPHVGNSHPSACCTILPPLLLVS